MSCTQSRSGAPQDTRQGQQTRGCIPCLCHVRLLPQSLAAHAMSGCSHNVRLLPKCTSPPTHPAYIRALCRSVLMQRVQRVASLPAAHVATRHAPA
eukprot:355906-Chlamydomonas_euryale.AAC.4